MKLFQKKTKTTDNNNSNILGVYNNQGRRVIEAKTHDHTTAFNFVIQYPTNHSEYPSYVIKVSMLFVSKMHLLNDIDITYSKRPWLDSHCFDELISADSGDTNKMPEIIKYAISKPDHSFIAENVDRSCTLHCSSYLEAPYRYHLIIAHYDVRIKNSLTVAYKFPSNNSVTAPKMYAAGKNVLINNSLVTEDVIDLLYTFMIRLNFVLPTAAAFVNNVLKQQHYVRSEIFIHRFHTLDDINIFDDYRGFQFKYILEDKSNSDEESLSSGWSSTFSEFNVGNSLVRKLSITNIQQLNIAIFFLDFMDMFSKLNILPVREKYHLKKKPV